MRPRPRRESLWTAAAWGGLMGLLVGALLVAIYWWALTHGYLQAEATCPVKAVCTG